MFVGDGVDDLLAAPPALDYVVILERLELMRDGALVSAYRSGKVLHAQLAALTLLMLGTPSLLLGMLLLAWTALAVWQCRK